MKTVHSVTLEPTEDSPKHNTSELKTVHIAMPEPNEDSPHATLEQTEDNPQCHT